MVKNKRIALLFVCHLKGGTPFDETEIGKLKPKSWTKFVINTKVLRARVHKFDKLETIYYNSWDALAKGG